MVRVFLLLVVVQVVLAALALIDCLSAERHQVRALPRVVWVPVLLLVPLLGPVAWFLLGRPAPARSGPHPTPQRRRAVAPDDDPEFLTSLAESSRQQDEELFRRWEEDLRRREQGLRRQGDPHPAGDATKNPDPDPPKNPDPTESPDPDPVQNPDRRTDPDQAG